jgi:hypothetical protein
VTSTSRRLVAGFALAGALAAQVDPVVVGRCFRVCGHGVDEQAARQALSTVEPVWPAVCAFFGAPSTPPPTPLTVHLYRSVDDYRAADRRLTGGRFGPNQAMSHWRTKSSHVAVQPPCPDALLAARGLPMQTRAMLAWEACHIARYELCANFRVHPGWFFDGLAAAVSLQVLPGAELAAQPFFSQRLVRAGRLAEGGDLPGVRQLLIDETQGLQMRDRYAARIAFFAFAEQRAPDSLRQVARTIRATAAGTTYAGTVAAAAAAELGGLQRSFHDFVEAAQPRWDERVRSLWRSGDGLRQHAFAEADAIALRAASVRGEGVVVRGEVCIEPYGPKEMRVLFGWQPRGGYALAMAAGEGFKLLSVASDGSDRAVLGEARCDGLREGAFCRFELTSTGRAVRAQVAGGELEVELPEPLPATIRWGLSARSGGAGAEFGSVGVWRGVRVRAR